jgi:redox-sensitive bicupin YhaK (pirin superfamily)
LNRRDVLGLVPAHRQAEGGGFIVRRPFPAADISAIDPFLLLDEMGPVEYAPGRAVGAPDHPHRGFETVTYLLAGEIEHRDSNGGFGVITPGAVQWMTAGAGIVHSEMPTDQMMRRGGRMHGFQLWVNLRAVDKMMPPRYQGYEAHDIPTKKLPGGGELRVIAGEVDGLPGVVDTTSPVTFAHVSLRIGESLVWSVPDGHTVLVHPFVEGVRVNGVDAAEGHLVVCSRGSGAVEVTAVDNECEVLLLGGEPLNEPIVRYGPFVMNTREEIIRAFEDHEAGRLGSIVATGPGTNRG